MSNVLAIMGKEGDTKIIFDPSQPAEVENARRSFNELKAKGYIAYSVKAGGDKGEIMREFDPKCEKIIMAPPMVGG